MPTESHVLTRKWWCLIRTGRSNLGSLSKSSFVLRDKNVPKEEWDGEYQKQFRWMLKEWRSSIVGLQDTRPLCQFQVYPI